ncbi:MAG: tripartite tricarboxylate transporter substrate binding protein, partial [Candidatus Afipia apatlaquensis]|nr:tripartite tricarboxylate transporter substrate binding protein [Candidatus Afipia apatlaquensis]
MRIAFIFATIGIALETLLAAPAQAYPVNQIQLTVPFPAGGTTDVLARELGARLSKELDVTVIIQNRPGASATVGSQFVARAAPDGSQLLLGSTHHVINPTLQKSLPYDTKKDFTDIALVALVPNALVVNPDLPVRSVADLIKLAKEKPGTLNFGSPGVGSANHLAGELFKSMAGIDMMHVPYPGAAPAMANLIGGHIQVMFDSLPTVLANAEAGKLRILAVTNGERVSSLPDT